MNSKYKYIKIISLNILVFITILSSSIFFFVLFGEVFRYSKNYYLSKTSKCIRSSCLETYKNIPWARKHFEEHGQVKFHYESPVVWRGNEFHGETINVDLPYYTRRTINNNLENSTKTVFFFGGSVMKGFGSNNENTIPSHFSKISNYKSLNFGEDAWVSDQSLLYLIKLIKDGNKPDYVIFLNGANDVSKCSNINGKEHSFLTEDQLRDKLDDNIIKQPKLSFSYYFQIPIEVVKSLKRLNPEQIINEKRPENLSECLKTDLHSKIARNLVNNWMLADNLVQQNGGKFFAFLEPHIAFTNTKIDNKIVWFPNSLHDNQVKAVYFEINNLIKNKINMKTFQSIYNNIDDYIFIDHAHVTPKANEIMAEKIFQVIKNSQ